MTGKTHIDIVAGLMLATGVVLAAVVVRLGADSAWVLTAPLLLSLTVLVTDLTVSHLQGGPLRPGPASLFLASSFLIAGLMVGLHDPQAMGSLIPILGAGCGVPLVLGRRRHARECRPN